MNNLVEGTYAQTEKSTTTNEMGMRAMQARAYEARDSQYLLIKAPPASGKSRALMFIALDKLYNQGVEKAVVAVPEKSIGGSFDDTELVKYGFFTDWEVDDLNNLCTPGGEARKVKAFKRFLAGNDRVLVCTHSTLRSAYQELDDSAFDDVILAIDEFHHVSAEGDNVLGDALRSLISNSKAHIVAMTGSYFRGDSVPILEPEDEDKFSKVTFNYYEQLNGYKYLKSLGIGYHFYQGRYPEAIAEVLDTTKKTIIHIPHVNSNESTGDKYSEVDGIYDAIGDHQYQDKETGVHYLRRDSDGKLLKVADLVWDQTEDRVKFKNIFVR